MASNTPRPGPSTRSAAPQLSTSTAPQLGQSASSSSQRPPLPSDAASSSRTAEQPAAKKSKKRRRKRRQSFVPAMDAPPPGSANGQGVHAPFTPQDMPPREAFYRAGAGGNLSDESLESEALLDHRDQAPMRTRRDSRVAFGDPNVAYRPNYANPFVSTDSVGGRRPSTLRSGDGDDMPTPTNDRTPLLQHAVSEQPAAGASSGRDAGGHARLASRHAAYGTGSFRPSSVGSSRSGAGVGGRQRTRTGPARHYSNSLLPPPALDEYDVNHPPSVPPSPTFGPQAGGPGDVLASDVFRDEPELERRPTGSRHGPGDHLIDIDGDGGDEAWKRSSPGNAAARLLAAGPEGDVCFPVEGMSELGEADFLGTGTTAGPPGEEDGRAGRRKRGRLWPDLEVLAEWSRQEQIERSAEGRTKKISEPVLVGGRLRPQKHGWRRDLDDAPYRFFYFNEELPSTIYSETISELLQPGQAFSELFVPDPPELSDSESEAEEDLMSQGVAPPPPSATESKTDMVERTHTRESSIQADARGGGAGGMGNGNGVSRATTERSAGAGTGTDATLASPHNGSANPSPPNEKAPASSLAAPKPKRYGARPTFWLDVVSPTEAEMRVIQKAFGIHPLTAEDILMQEAREKVELFRNYYFVNYRTFEQDAGSDEYLEPVNMYVVVFREGVLSFHFSMTPHPANVRRRIRQLKDYLVLTADWISYAIIDDITDVFVPLIASVEAEVNEIDDDILQLLTSSPAVSSGGGSGVASEKGGANSSGGDAAEKASLASGRSASADVSGGDMLRRVGQGRKKVMRMYRLLGNKADVIKGFAKRCNEQWKVAPRSEIGLYLGDIQDHVLTMTGNLSHFETLLSRAHSNYLAQINIRMNERQEQTADVLGKLTVLGTIVLPMNIITGMWGMNVQVPGQNVENLIWFWCITAGLVAFGVSCFFIAKRVYGIV